MANSNLNGHFLPRRRLKKPKHSDINLHNIHGAICHSAINTSYGIMPSSRPSYPLAQRSGRISRRNKPEKVHALETRIKNLSKPKTLIDLLRCDEFSESEITFD